MGGVGRRERGEGDGGAWRRGVIACSARGPLRASLAPMGPRITHTVVADELPALRQLLHQLLVEPACDVFAGKGLVCRDHAVEGSAAAFLDEFGAVGRAR